MIMWGTLYSVEPTYSSRSYNEHSVVMSNRGSNITVCTNALCFRQNERVRECSSSTANAQPVAMSNGFLCTGSIMWG